MVVVAVVAVFVVVLLSQARVLALLKRTKKGNARGDPEPHVVLVVSVAVDVGVVSPESS